MTLDIDKATQIRDFLNSNLVDPLGASRRGLQFYTWEDDFNLNRADTFPKAVITKITENTELKSFGPVMHQKENDVYGIWYYVKAGQKYTRPDTSAVVSNPGFASYMAGKIKELLKGDTRAITAGVIIRVSQDPEVRPITSPNSKITLWRSLVTLELLSVNSG